MLINVFVERRTELKKIEKKCHEKVNRATPWGPTAGISGAVERSGSAEKAK
jgi:hypothetical protein